MVKSVWHTILSAEFSRCTTMSVANHA
jgi:hypothetical protein